jgi:signal peptidase I
LAKRSSNYQLKNYNRFYIYLLWPILYFGIGELLPANNSISTFSIPTNGMENTLMVDDMIFADMNYFNFNTVKRNDLVIFNDPKYPHKLLIKRAIAFEDEKISIVNGKIFINEQAYKENNQKIIYETDYYADLNETVIPKNHIFFIGDNRPNSLDSRMFGTVPEHMVKGKPLYIYLSDSFNRIGINLH